MPTVTLTPTAYRVRRFGSEDAALPMESGEDWQGIRRSMMRFAAPSDFAGATINQATLTWTVGYYSGFGESGISILGIIANDTPFANQSFDPQPFMGDQQRVIRDENYWENVPSLGMVAAAGTELVDDLTAMVAQAMAAGRFSGGEMQFLWTTNEFYSDYYQFTVGTPSLFIDYTPPPLTLSTSANTVQVGSTINGTVTRHGNTNAALEVSLSQSPSGRVTIPATVTIPAASASQTFAVTGLVAGAVTLTATEGSDTANRSITVRNPLPIGLGGEVVWICPSLDNDGNGTGTAFDLSGNDLDATLMNMDPATDWPADTDNGGVRAIDLDGQNDYLRIDHNDLIDFERTDAFSITGWIKTNASGAYGVVSKLDPNPPYRGYELWLTSGGTQVNIYNSWPSNALERRVSAETYNALGGVWRAFGIVYDGSSTPGGVSIYWNGVLRAATTIQNSLTATIKNTLPLLIGSRGGAVFGAMRIDDVRVYERALTIAELAHLHSARAVTGGPPVDALTLDAVTRSVGSGLVVDYEINALTLDAVTRSVGSGLVADFEIAALTLDAITRSVGSGALAELAYNALTLDAVTRSVGSGLIADYEIEAVIGDAISRSIGSGLLADYEIDAATWDAVTRSISSGLSAGFAYDAVTRDAITRSLGSGLSADYEAHAATRDAVTRSIASGLSAGLSFDAVTRDAVTRSIAGGLSAALVYDAVTRDAVTRSFAGGIVARLLRRRTGLFPNQLFPHDLLG